MRVLLVHNAYQQYGGEDVVFETEGALLRANGHAVATFTADNARVAQLAGPVSKARLAAQTVWSQPAARALRAAVQAFQPDIVHFHNTFPLISPAGYGAARSGGAAVVQTLHNYRLVCPAATCFRDGAVCTECVGRTVPLPSVRYGCYRGSRVQTLPVAAMLTVHARRRTWQRDVDRYIVLSEAQRALLLRGGLPADRLTIKPNVVAGVAPGPELTERSNVVVFAGRLTEEKGVRTVVEAWRGPDRPASLHILGDGPLRAYVEAAAAVEPHIVYPGFLPRHEMLKAMAQARLVIAAPIWEEPFGLTVIEAFGCGTPVLASAIGAPGELVGAGGGALFAVGDPVSLRSAADALLADQASLSQLGREARERFETTYAPAAGYAQLIAVYRAALAQRHGHATSDDGLRKQGR
jgi:glycosyltransferase involved in cell wall biosynthesis